jgi:hypothetical protein
VLALAERVEGTKGCVERLQAMMLARKLTYFNTKTLTLNLANLKLGEGVRDFPFILFQNSFYLFIYFEIFDFMICNDGKQKHVVEKE